MSNNNALPRVIFVDRDRDIAPGTVYGPVYNDHYIFECCVDGGGALVLNGTEFEIGVGQGYVIPPGVSVTMLADPMNSRVCLWCAIVGDMVADVLSRAGITAEKPYIPATAYREVKDAISELLRTRDETDDGAPLRRAANVYRLLGALLRDNTNVDKNFWVNKAIGIMETKYPQPLTVTDISCLVGLDRAYFSTLFRSVTGQTPHAFLTELRVRKACTLLDTTDIPVSSVAEAVGIDPKNFARIFRALIGITPREYIIRKQTQKD